MRVSKIERDKLILDNLKLIIKIISKHHSYADFDDYVNQGVLAFIKAIEKFDPTKGVKLTTYAYRVVRNELLDYSMKNRVVASPVSRKVQTSAHFVGDDDWIFDAISSHEASVEKEILDEDLMRKLKSRLNAKEWKALKLLQDGYKIFEVKKATGLTRGQLKKLHAKIADLL